MTENQKVKQCECKIIFVKDMLTLLIEISPQQDHNSLPSNHSELPVIAYLVINLYNTY